MTVAVFGITYEKVRAHHFPHLSAFTASTSPSSTTVTEKIEEGAARLAGALLSEGIPTSAIVAGTAEYVQCASIVRLMGARGALEAMAGGGSPDLAKRWDAAIEEWFKKLDAEGPTFLGNEDLSTLIEGDADGPTDHITEYGLTVSSDDPDPSDATNPMRKDDEM